MRETRTMRDAVARALIADIHERDLPKDNRETARRQTIIAQAVARANGWRHADVADVVRDNWGKVYGWRKREVTV